MLGDWTVHGGRLSDARAAYRDAPEPWLDLSTGINPHPWPGAEAIVPDWHALPDERELAELEVAAAACFGVDPRYLCALPGAEIGLRLLGSLGLPEPMRFMVPGYRTHGEAFRDARPIGRDATAAVRDGTLLFANPNNPDGQIVEAAATSSDGWMVVDESFADAVPGCSVAHVIAEDARLLVLRSFGKFFGLAGVRLGFLLGPGARIGRMRRAVGSWPVSSAALRIGTAAYRDAEWIAAMRGRLVAEAAALDAMLARRGFVATGACPLFRLIEVDDAAGLFDRLARRGILTRPFDYAPRWLRIGLPGSDNALARLEKALADG